MLEIMFYKCSIWNIYRISRVFFSMMHDLIIKQIAHLNHKFNTLPVSSVILNDKRLRFLSPISM